MSGANELDGDFVPRWARGVRTRFDEVRQRWMILGPERIVVPEGPGADIAELVDGTRTVDDIIAELVDDYDADAEVIGGDTKAFLQQLLEQGYLTS